MVSEITGTLSSCQKSNCTSDAVLQASNLLSRALHSMRMALLRAACGPSRERTHWHGQGLLESYPFDLLLALGELLLEVRVAGSDFGCSFKVCISSLYPT